MIDLLLDFACTAGRLMLKEKEHSQALKQKDSTVESLVTNVDIKNSTLLVWGKNDDDTPLYMAKIMKKNIPDSGLVVLENAGHFSYLDNPQKYLLVTNEFLK